MRRVLAMVVLLVVAGCGGAPRDGGTLTPAPIPDGGSGTATTTTTPTGGPLASAVGPAGPDPFALAEAHGDALAGRSYTTVRTLSVVGANGTLRRVNTTARVAPGGAPVRLVKRAWSAPGYAVTPAADSVAIWYDGAATVYRVGEGNATYHTRGLASLASPLDDLDGEGRLVSTFAGFQRWNGACDPSGCRLVGTDPRGTSSLELPLLVRSPSNATVRVRLTPEGRVERLRLTYEARADGRAVTVVRELRFVAVGRTDITRPDWVPTGGNRTPGNGSEETAGGGSKVPL